jgi:hypothetical protein
MLNEILNRNISKLQKKHQAKVLEIGKKITKKEVKVSMREAYSEAMS